MARGLEHRGPQLVGGTPNPTTTYGVCRGYPALRVSRAGFGRGRLTAGDTGAPPAGRPVAARPDRCGTGIRHGGYERGPPRGRRDSGAADTRGRGYAEVRRPARGRGHPHRAESDHETTGHAGIHRFRVGGCETGPRGSRDPATRAGRRQKAVRSAGRRGPTPPDGSRLVAPGNRPGAGIEAYTQTHVHVRQSAFFHSNVCLAQPFETNYRCAARETIREGPT